MDEPNGDTRLPFGLKTEQVTLGLLVLSTVLVVVLVQQNNKLRAGYQPKKPCGCDEPATTSNYAAFGDRFAPDMEGVNGNGYTSGLRTDTASNSVPPPIG